MAVVDISMAFDLEKDLPPMDFVWPGFLAGTVGALIAPGGSGKSLWALEAAVAVAGGGDLLGLQPQHTGRVLYLAAEDPEIDLLYRLRAIARHLTEEQREAAKERLTIDAISGSGLDLLQERYLGQLIKACTDVRLLILDTFSRLHSGNENSNSDMARLITMLERIAKETKTTVLFIHHISKGAALSGQGDLQQAARGASALIDNARWCGYLCRMTKEEAAKLSDRAFDRQAIGEERRGLYLRFGVSKCNYSAPIPDRWLVRENGVLRAVELRPAEEAKEKGGKDHDRSRL